MASVTVSLVIPAPRDEVWAVISDVANARRWNASWTRIEIITEQTQGKGTRFRTHNREADDTFEFEISDWTAPEYIAFAPVRDPEERRYDISLDWHAFRLTPEEGGKTRVDLTASATTRGIRGRFVGMVFWPGHQRAGLTQALRSLGEVFGMEAEEAT
jgi:uncharacterized protein YndB with AHSA1/START domain